MIKKRDLQDITFAFFDLETTGLDPAGGDKICEVAVLRSRNGQDLGSFNSLVNPGRMISLAAYAVNRITQEMLAGKPKFNQIASEVLKMFDDAVIVCHNAPFDMGFLRAELKEAGLSFPDCRVIDTLALARRRFSFSDNSLDSIAGFLGIKVGQSHRAMDDCITTQQIFQKFLEDFRWKGIVNLDELLCL
jgi:DNA polymerase-3 subunit epsilon